MSVDYQSVSFSIPKRASEALNQVTNESGDRTEVFSIPKRASEALNFPFLGDRFD